ncbi:SseB family protein [Homoserinibacter sp. YIM 151385]|uniref:SseB family protein n=1 Tax=Homoserinibacter sp. YIM 151385 TaxID=2985506 RepID=UPI0022F0DE2E|nr:SseB family protein [Homoserinibacter sp. YIM 151385]WBU38881.1 SseB family protein [Homoserinibacter sp. YIM 151385]
MASADSAGIPFEGRAFHPNPLAGDDGGADPRLLEALRRFRLRETGEREVLAALRGARLLVPLLAHRGEEGVGAHGQLVDKTQELAIVTVTAADGRAVLPAFSSVETLQRWNPQARPVPVDPARAALAAASDGTELLVLDPTSETEFALRRSALRALATGEAWVPPVEDAAVLAAFRAPAAAERAVLGLSLAQGDPSARLLAPEVLVELSLAPGLDRAALDALLARLQAAWAAEAVVAERVDSIGVRLRRA